MATERVWTRAQVAHILGVQESAVKLWKEEERLVPSYPASLPVSGGRTVDGYTRNDLEKGVILSGNIQERRIKHPPPPGYVEVSTVSALFQISDMQSRSLIRRNEIPHYYYKPVRSPVTIYKYADILELFERVEEQERIKAASRRRAQERTRIRNEWKKKLKGQIKRLR